MSFEYFTITPRIVKTGVTTRISVKPRYEQRSVAALLQKGKLYGQTVSNSGLVGEGRYPYWGEYDPLEIHADAEGNEIWMDITPESEGELSIRLMHEETGGRKVQIIGFDVYACDEDLYELRPYRGDMHVHTSYSECGNRDENPRFVAAWGCYAGLDYIVITDHAQREPSVLARSAIEEFGSDYQVFNGEEVHMLSEVQETLVCRNRFIGVNHIVNFGGREGVVKYMNEHFDEYMSEVKERAARLPEDASEPAKFVMAGADWIIDKIHEFGGIAIFAHPYWRPEKRRNLPDVVREHIMKAEKFDCMEVIGLGEDFNCVEGNMNCVAWWQQENMKRGRMIPVVGNTDSHGTRTTLNRRATIVFAKDNSFEGLTSAIKAGRSVAGVFSNNPPQLYGDPRYVQYSYFLLRNYYPEHDDMCKTVGKLMLDSLNGEMTCAEAKPIVKNRLTKLFAKYWGK